MTFLKLFRAALRFQTSFLAVASMLRIPFLLAPSSVQCPVPIIGTNPEEDAVVLCYERAC